MSIFTKNSLVFIIGLLCCFQVLSQNDKQQELEQKRIQLQEEIKQINTLLFSTRTKEKSVLAQVEDITKRIQTRENLIKVTNQQANFITREINANTAKIGQLRNELETMKKDYAKLIVKSYQNRSQQNKIMFLFSSENFLQAYKRAQYIKQYARHRKKQGIEIEGKTVELQELNKQLIEQQREKQKLIDENRLAREKLQEEKQQQEQLVASLKKDESRYVTQVKDKQREAAAIDKQIEDIIKAAIAESNKSADKKVVKTSSTTFAMTAEAKALAANFKSNKGKLPWPVAKGVVITRFGTTQHPTLPNVKTYSSGVEIATEEGAKARASFDGEVLAVTVIRGANKAVQIRHGDYITVYQNITDVYVKKGELVKTKQEIGKIFTNPSTGKTILKFLIFQNTEKLNPSEWVFSM